MMLDVGKQISWILICFPKPLPTCHQSMPQPAPLRKFFYPSGAVTTSTKTKESRKQTSLFFPNVFGLGFLWQPVIRENLICAKILICWSSPLHLTEDST